ncbi:alpha/beta fold hydrolase [Pseudoponticoccus marisrubri]|uniref:AB hydrolase-1 domain-containing protein n=1 Tax=Pseudoponticoccus marisrubri TaxID=1685382 RepID=A0A0W7WNM6_9RHOB|nr:alpha/beta fold hydrolase [Pseudoponticoccus marisrubri]KUF12213.1 hypothetical protein AVJ23_00300 [Pseudoponticoccus marisrubri]
MPMLRITVTDQGPHLDGAAGPLHPALARALAADGGPVTIMIHGFKYLPGHSRHCPHRSLQSDAAHHADARIVSWPRHLGLRGQRGEGLGISFGWPARGSIWQAHRRAAQAGDALAGLVAQIRQLAPQRPVHVVAHSLGARVALQALRQGRPGAVDRAILMAAAEFTDTARAALTSPGGRACEVLNVTSRENDLFDFLMERLVAPPRPGDRMLGLGALRLPNLVTLQLDDAESLHRLRAAGFAVAPPMRRICHWSPYLRPGVFPLYRAVLSGALPLPRLRALLPDAPQPRWSRLVPVLARPATRAIAAE